MKRGSAQYAKQTLQRISMQKQIHAGENAGVYSTVKSIEECGEEDVYCIAVPAAGNFVANGMVVKNCDALRYAVFSAFPRGEFSHPDENISYDQLRRNVFGNNDIYSQFNSELGF